MSERRLSRRGLKPPSNTLPSPLKRTKQMLVAFRVGFSRPGFALGFNLRRKVVFFLASVLLLLAHPISAQEATPEPIEGSLISYGQVAEGTLNFETPRLVYAFEGMRGEVINVDLAVLSGDLDPVVTLVDETGALLASRDDGGFTRIADDSRALHLEAVRIPRSDRYYLVVGRFGYSLGSTAGDFALTLERIGVSSASGSALRYGDSVSNTITDANPAVYYTFQGRRGDIISVQMLAISGNLDAFVQIVNSASIVVEENDDALGLDAAVNGLVIREDGTYVIIATRFGQGAGRSSGSFVLTLESAAQSGLGRRLDAALPLAYGDSIEGELTDDAFTQFYTFDGQPDDVITIRMDRVDGDLDPLVALLDPQGNEIINDDDSGEGQNSIISGFALPTAGRYTLVATRFDRQAGTTTGRYALTLESAGNAFVDAAPDAERIAYGGTAAGRIDDATPQQVFAFRGAAGDVVTLTMNRVDGDLDPFVSILDAEFRTLVSDDDSGGDRNSRISSYTLPANGLYYVQASRYSGTDGNPNSAGGFVVALAGGG
jgi:hypothetical protein